MPVGVVPRISHSGYIRTELIKGAYADPIERAVDECLTAQRKSKAWDELQRLVGQSDNPYGPIVVGLMSQILESETR